MVATIKASRFWECDLDNAELPVLHRKPEGWLIATVHWSSSSHQ